VPGFLAQSAHLEPKAISEANEAAGLSALPEPLVARFDFLEVGGGDVEIESEVLTFHDPAGSNVKIPAHKDSAGWNQ
jgi:hypothetical protein